MRTAQSLAVIATALLVGIAGSPAAGDIAYAGSGGSVYSILGIGDIRTTPGPRAQGMGYAGISLLSSQDINPLSPATWSAIDRTHLEASALYEGYNSTDVNASRYLARLDYYGAVLAIPIAPSNGIVLVGGFLPFSNVDYDSYTKGSYQSSADTLEYSLHHTGTGGITRAMVGLSWRPLAGTSVGASFNYLFGTLTQSMTQTATSSDGAGGTIISDQTTSGVNFTFGIVYDGFGSIAEVLRPFSVGVVASTRANLHTTDQINYQYSAEADTSDQTLTRIGIPFSYGIGIAYRPSERWALAADYSAQPWRHMDFEGGAAYGIRNSSRFSIGAERAGVSAMRAAWSEKVSYRVGTTYYQTYYSLGGENINEWTVTAGLGLPFSGESRLNIAAEFGTRGTTANGLVKDKIFRMTFSLNISDLWFVRAEEE